MADLIAGRYELGERIGAGGMAEVFRAVDHQLGRTVAVKILNREYTSQPAFVERFRREAQAAASLDHPAIVPIYDWGETDDSYYIVMAYVAGQTLRETFFNRHPAPVDEIVGIISRVAAGLQHAHDRGIVHRDIKPQNILIDEGGNPRITDFGIAQAAGQSSLTETSMVLGTATYISPEQAMRRPIDARSDIYSLGVVTYELLAGRPPFHGDSIVELAMQHVHEEPPPIGSDRQDVPEGVEQLVLTCLAKDPDQRLQSAGELAAALDRIRENPAAVPVTAPTVPVAAAATANPGPATNAPTRAMRGRGAPPARSAAPVSGGNKRAVWAAIAVVGLALVVVLALLMNQLGNSEGQNAGVTDDGDGSPTTEEGEGVAPEVTEDQEDEPVDENEPVPTPTEPQQPEPTEAPDENTDQQDEPPTEEQPDDQNQAPPENAPEDAPGQQENGGDEGDQGNTDPESAIAQLQSDGECNGTFESVNVDGLVVPADGTCTLISGQVSDDVIVEPGGTLQATGVEILDNVEANQASSVNLTGNSYVDGNLVFSEGESLRVADSTVEGNLELGSNPGPLQIIGNVIDGNVQVESNTGGVTITNNQIDGNLECSGNDPPPTGGGNSIAGNSQDQCANL